MCKHIVVLFMSYRYYKGFRQQKWPSNSLKVIDSHAIL